MNKLAWGKNCAAVRLLNFALLGIAPLISLVFVASLNKRGLVAACHHPECARAFLVKVCSWQSVFTLPCRNLPLIGCLNVPIYPQTGIQLGCFVIRHMVCSFGCGLDFAADCQI